MTAYFHDTVSCAAFGDQKLNKVNLFESPRLFCDVYCLAPGQFQKDHEHAENDKIYHVLTGSCRVRVGTQTRWLTAGQTAVAPAGVVHGLLNDSEAPATVLAVMAPHPDF